MTQPDKKVEATATEKVDTIEFVGTAPFGTEFTSSHTVSKSHLKEYHEVELPVKELVWNRKNKFRVPVSEMGEDVAKVLAEDPMFKRVQADA